jgi:hypothetical protein
MSPSKSPDSTGFALLTGVAAIELVMETDAGRGPHQDRRAYRAILSPQAALQIGKAFVER